jgi:hypothetical protein
VNVGGGARWFLRERVAVGFDVRFHRLLATHAVPSTQIVGLSVGCPCDKTEGLRAQGLRTLKPEALSRRPYGAGAVTRRDRFHVRASVSLSSARRSAVLEAACSQSSSAHQRRRCTPAERPRPRTSIFVS